MIRDMHVIIKNRKTFEVFDYPYATVLTVSGSLYTINYYADAAHTGSYSIATHATADYFVYVVPGEEA